MPMKLRDYREDLLTELKAPEFAAHYLDELIALKDRKALMLALKDVVDARGGVGALADKVTLQRQSQKHNPRSP